MMIKGISYKYLQSQLKIDQPYFMRLFKEKITKVLELETLKVFLLLLKRNKIKEEISQIYDLDKKILT